jgi:SAM-dependent methyltransferase
MTGEVTQGQRWEAQSYVVNAGFVAELGAPVVELLAPRAGERILDLGCGDGRLTERIAAMGAEVVGADAAPDLLAAARARGIDVVLADGHRLPFVAAFDAVFSNAALHWMTRPDAVIAEVRRALRPRGRFVGEFGGHGNVAAIVTALLATLAKRGGDGMARFPWFFPTEAEYARLLVGGGFRVREIALIPRPTALPTGMAGWLDAFANPFMVGLGAADRAAALDEAVALLAPTLRDGDGRWTADYVRLRFAAELA